MERLGKGMLVGGWVLLLGLLTLLFQSVLERQHNPNDAPVGSLSDRGAREVVLVRNRVGHYLVTGAINGHPATFMVDTGATDVAVPKGLAERIGLQPGVAYTSRTANGPVTVRKTWIERLKIGNIELLDVQASILPSMSGDEVLLGMSALKSLELIQRGRQLTLRQYPR